MGLLKSSGEFFRELLDTHGRIVTLGAIIVAVGGGAVVTGLVNLIGNLHGWLLSGVFVMTAGGFIILAAYAVRSVPTKVAQQQGTQTSSVALAAAALTPPVNWGEFIDKFFHQTYSGQLQAETEGITRAMIQSQHPDTRDDFIVRFIATGIVNVIYDSIWKSIFRSQVLALQELNRRYMRKEELKPFYDDGVNRLPAVYENYTFDQWLEYMRSQLLILEHPGQVFEITVRGKDFLKYMVHLGYKPEDRNA